ncbi:MAG: metallopeptidase family protein [Chloroflexota bacterium]|nr:metallopeptidase family protein [Chloroflexota bacterium]
MRDRIRHRVEQARRQRFERLVVRALDGLSPEVVAMLDNVNVIVEDEPTAEQLTLGWGYPEQPVDVSDGPEEMLFGLYEGVPLTRRGADYHLVPPDRITIFRGPLERAYTSPQAIAREVRITIMHELGHHLGFEEDRLEVLGLG